MIGELIRGAIIAQNTIVCDTVEPLSTPFDAVSYMGTWYNIQHSKGAAFQPESFECT